MKEKLCKIVWTTRCGIRWKETKMITPPKRGIEIKGRISRTWESCPHCDQYNLIRCPAIGLLVKIDGQTFYSTDKPVSSYKKGPNKSK